VSILLLSTITNVIASLTSPNIFHYVAPTSPPLSPTGVAVSSSSLSLSWHPPPPEHENGLIRQYIVNITEVATGRIFQHTTPTNSLLVSLLHPYYTYQWTVSAYTVGNGPYTNLSTVTTPEDGQFHL